MSEERRCDTCQRLVMAYDEHKDYDCGNWPECPNNGVEVEYREYVICSHSWVAYQYVHKDYDGPEDSRCGTERTFVNCLMEIDNSYD